MKDREAVMAELITHLPTGRENAISVSELGDEIWVQTNRRIAASTVRARIHETQAAGFPVLSSPRAGVWMAADEGEVLDVIDELRAGIAALEARMQLINGGKCALRSCRVELSEKTKRRGGLYCKPAHRYLAAVERGSS